MSSDRLDRPVTSPPKEAQGATELARVQGLLDAQAGFIKRAQGKTVRITRAIVIEGEATAVLKQLALSLPVGLREVRKGELTINIVSGPLEILG
jgi:hypothetical protein